ncbi:hypothetical protein LAZ67_18001986 [Cordylochernes scorpioides]|uniref:CCHC-type domain-containing protein n=1 Tax=Cordylochernes scorpioides TaxID=51811 RepID=A0ABY6LIE3_9ARAC|nr:hypothetical protein LAZ67_18001986 [Cordylochernes scorpioides]
MSRDERILQRKLSCQIRRIDGFIESVDSIIQAGETIRLEIMGEELKEIKEKIETLYDELFSLDEVDIDKESEAYDGSMNKIGSLRVKIENERKLKEKLADIKPNGSQANIKLPQFDLPIYDGDMGKWINFKELFLTTIDAHPGLTNIQKLQYLNSAVKGEAARLIRGFPLLSENYGQAWNTLLSRYDNPRELAYAQVSKIFSLRAIKNPSAKCLHEFMDVCNEAIRNLETLELKRNQLVDVILVHFLQQKLSENLRLDWELSVDNTLPSYDKFIAFISRHARSMSCAVRECSKREETTGSRFPKCQSYGMLIEKSDTCILCKSRHHPLYMCNLFCKMPLKEKLNVVKGHKLCFNCLRKGHFSWNCRLNQRCKVCKGKHHTMIHYDKPSTEGASAQVENTTPKEHESAINLTNTQQANCNDSHVLLATARIKIKNGLGKLCTCRALLDSGSQVTMITKGCCERLGLVQRKSDRMIIGVGGTPVQHSSSTVSVTFCPLNNSEEFSVEAVVTGVLTSEIPNFRLKDPNWPTLKNLKLADPEFYIQAPIDMILGADIYTELMLNGSISIGEGLPMAINTRLGWVLLGKIMGTSESNTEVCNLSLQSEPELEFVMKRFWEIESVPSPDLCTQDEDCERLFSNNHSRDSHGRYWVKLPFRQHRPLLGESREKALRGFLSLEGKLCKNVKLYDQYRGFMKEYEHLNHMERVPIAEVKREVCRCYYMPHHPEDADYQRILWRPSPEEPVVDYRLLTVTYGTTSAPFLAMRTLQQLAEDEGQNYPEASRVTLNDFYVDDLLTGAQTIAETKELIDQLKDLMKKGGFHLRKWNSNCHEIVSHVEEINEERKINLEKGAISKILGIVWDHVQDTFRVNITLPEEVVTKRDLLSNIARIFDPLGFLSPTTVAMANLQRQTAVKEVEDLEGLPVYHRAILKENGEWPEVTKAIQCSYPKVFVGDGTHLYLLIEDVESLDGPNVRSVLYQYHIPHKKWIWRGVNGFAPIVISKSIVYASHDKRVYFVGGRIHSRGNKVTCTDNIVRVKLKEGRASVLVKSRKSPLTDLLVLAMTFAPSAFLFMLAETRDHSTCKVFSYHLLNKDWHLIGSNKIFWKEKFLSLQICYTNKKLLLFPRMQWEQHFCNLYNYRLQTDSWGCYTTIPILGEKEGYPKNINHFTIVQDWVRAVFVHAGKESKYLWKLNLKSKQWTELPTYVKYRDSQYTAVALDLVFILGPADKEHETAEKYLSFFKTRSLCQGNLLTPPVILNSTGPSLPRSPSLRSGREKQHKYTNKDTMLCADAFSRLPLEEINSREDNIDLVTHDISLLNVTPLDHLIIEEETNKDPVLNKLKEYLLEDPQLAKKDETMKPFLSKLDNFSILQGCIFVDSRAVIPRTCQDQMLKLLHQGHIGINCMKSLARSSVWWPKMDSQIEEFVKECSPCMHHQTAPPAENTPWPRTNQPWQRVHVDHFYFRDDCYLLVVDANSNWIQVSPVRGTTSQENIKLLRECFARNTPTSLDKPPVERLLSYVPRTFVNCLNSEFIQRTFGRNECGRRHFQVGDKVLFTRVIQNRRKWFKAQVIRRLGYNVYLVKNLKGTFKVHVNQMRTGSDTKYAEDSDWTLDNSGAGPHRLEQDPQISTSPPPRRSTRPRCPPCRFSPTMYNIRNEE